jgi:hypothetical protein
LSNDDSSSGAAASIAFQYSSSESSESPILVLSFLVARRQSERFQWEQGRNEIHKNCKPVSNTIDLLREEHDKSLFEPELGSYEKRTGVIWPHKRMHRCTVRYQQAWSEKNSFKTKPVGLPFPTAIPTSSH